jgi:hypothetical protein
MKGILPVALTPLIILLAGCTSSKQMGAEVTVFSGCLVHVKEVKSESAGNVQDKWTFDEDCKVTVTATEDKK